MDKKDLRVAFVHGRPKGHPLHAAYAKSVGADFYHEDRLLRWHDRPDATKIKRYLSWVINALTFPKVRQYDVILTECIRIPQLIMKRFGILSSKQKLVALMGDESLYFISINRYPKLTLILMKSFLNACDVIICTGKFQTLLATQIVTNKQVKIVYVYNGIKLPPTDYKPSFSFTENKILFLGNIESDWRTWYKGLDIMIRAFEIVSKEREKLEFHIIGEVSEDQKVRILNNITTSTVQKSIVFNGYSKNLYNDIKEYDLLLHIARGEAWGVTVHMAMATGLPCIVSELTGTKELVEQVDKNLVTTIDLESIVNKLKWYFSLSNNEKVRISNKSIEVASLYDEKDAIKNFNEAFIESIR